MRLHIIQPTYYTDRDSRRLFKTKKLNLKPLTLPYLAALVPSDVEVTLIDEKTQTVDVNRPVNGVFLTVWTLTSFRTNWSRCSFGVRGYCITSG